MSYSYSNDFVHTSPVRAEALGTNLENGSGKAVMYDEEGNVVLATDGAKAVGVLQLSTGASLEKGDTVSFLTKDTGLMKSGEAITKGSLVSVNSEGLAITAKTGAVVFGRAFTSSSEAGAFVQVQISPCGATLGG